MAQSNGTREAPASPYASTDPNSNVSNFKIIESTLRGKIYAFFFIALIYARYRY